MYRDEKYLYIRWWIGVALILIVIAQAAGLFFGYQALRGYRADVAHLDDQWLRLDSNMALELREMHLYEAQVKKVHTDYYNRYPDDLLKGGESLANDPAGDTVLCHGPGF